MARPDPSDTGQLSAGSHEHATSATQIAARIDRVPTGRFHVKVAAILGTGTFFDGFDAVNIATVLPLVITTFGIGLGDAGLIISAGYAGQFVGALVIGTLADRIGRRPAFLLSLLVAGALSVGSAVAWSETSLLAFRLAQGIGLGAEVPVAGVLINELLGRRSRGRVAVLYQSLYTWGLFFAPLVALLTVNRFGPELGWRVLLVIGALPLAVGIWAWFALPESPRWSAVHGRPSGAERLVSRMEAEALARGATLSEPSPVPEPRSTGLRLGELFSAGYWRRTTMLAVVWFTTFFVTHGYITWLPTMYVSVGHLPQSESLELTVIVGVVQLAVVYLSAWLVERWGRRTLLIIGFGVALIGATYAGVAIGLLGHRGWPVLFAAGIILALGTTVPAALLYLYTSELYPLRMRGWATSAASSMNRAASITAPFIFGLMLAGHGGAGGVFIALAVATAIGLVALIVAGVETRGRSLDELSA